MTDYIALTGLLKDIAAKMKDPDLFASRLIRLGWGAVVAYGIAQIGPIINVLSRLW